MQIKHSRPAVKNYCESSSVTEQASFNLILKHQPAQETHIYIAETLSSSRPGDFYSSALTSYFFYHPAPGGNPNLQLFRTSLSAVFQQHIDRWKRSAEPFSPLPAESYYTQWRISCQRYARFKISAENNRDLSHTHRISAKSPVLKIFIRIHFLMEESGNGCWHGFDTETEGGDAVTSPLSV